MSEFMWGLVIGGLVMGAAQIPLMRLIYWQQRVIDALKEQKEITE